MELMLINTDYSRLITDKSVVLIGGGDYVVAHVADVHIRCNTNYYSPLQRADILYLSSVTSIDELETNLADPHLRYAWVNLACANGRLYSGLCTKHNVMHSYYHRYLGEDYLKHDTWSARLQARYCFYPLTGVLALAHLLIYKPKSVFVTGMDFYMDPVSRLIPFKKGAFHMDKQIQAVKDLIRESGGVVTVDDKLEYILTYPAKLLYS